jgi:hypothetical protein
MLYIAFVSTTIIAATNSIVRSKFIKRLHKKTSYNLTIVCPIETADGVIKYVESKSSNVFLNKFDIQYFTNQCILIMNVIDYENSFDSRKIYVQELYTHAPGIQSCVIDIT